MIRRVLFLSAALLCGSFSLAQATPAEVVAGCTGGSCDAAVNAELASIANLPAAEKDAAIDALLAALASVTPASAAVKNAVTAAIGKIGASYSSAEKQAQVASLQTAFSQKQVATAAVNVPAPVAGSAG